MEGYLGVGIEKGGSPKPEKEKGWEDASASRGWEATQQSDDSGCWVLIGDVPLQEMTPPTALSVLGRHFYILSPAVARQDVQNPKP